MQRPLAQNAETCAKKQPLVVKVGWHSLCGRLSFMHVIKSTFYSIVGRDIQEVCGSSGILTVVVLKFAGACWGAVALLTSYLTLNT